MAKKKKSEPKAESPKRKRPCFDCNGTGYKCNICGESIDVCDCSGNPDIRDCEECEGTGVASADRDGTEPRK